MDEKTIVSEKTKKLVGAIKALVNVYDLLNVGEFQGSFSRRVIEAQEFVRALHTQSQKEFEERPDFKEAMAELQGGSNEQKG